MKLSAKLQDPAYRAAWWRLSFSLGFIVVVAVVYLRLLQFVLAAQEVSERFKRTHLHSYDTPNETPHFGCKCADIHDRLVCVNCVMGAPTHLSFDEPEQTFLRSYEELKLHVCPGLASATGSVALVCHALVHSGLWAVVYCQERILIGAFHMVMLALVWCYVYFYPYKNWHELLEQQLRLESPLRPNKSSEAQEKYGAVELVATHYAETLVANGKHSSHAH